MRSQIEGHYGGVRVIAEGRGSQLFIGTTKNCILQGDLELGFSPAVLGKHFSSYLIKRLKLITDFNKNWYKVEPRLVITY